jgi:glycosyltransferase involved in cell wall biosynthesis
MQEKSEKQISVVVITKNEEKEIESFIQSARQVSNDIVVVDAESTDDTVKIAKSLGVKTYIHPWQGYGNNKNYGSSKAMHSWILSLDADERISYEMAETINNLNLDKSSVYSFKLTDHIGSRALRFSELRAKWKKRLFHRESIRWNDSSVHELLIIPSGTKIVKNKGKILHYSYDTINDLKEKYKLYALLGAEGLGKKNESISVLKKYIGPKWRFFRSYVIYLGFLEGKMGWQISKALHDMLQMKYEALEKVKRN